MKDKFLVTYDITTATALSKLGYIEIPNGNSKSHTFINDKTLRFDDSIDMGKIQFSNILCI